MNAESVGSQHLTYTALEFNMVRHTVNSLFHIMRAHFRNFPNDYLVFDVETTGVKVGYDLITQLGYCLVINNQIVDNTSLILDWTTCPNVFSPDGLKARLAATKQAVEMKDGQPTGRHYHMSYELMAQEGADPLAILTNFLEMLQSTRERQLFFVAHNGYHFDVRMLESHFHKHLDKIFVFGDNELFDTGMVEKGAQSQSTPWGGDTVRAWSLRTANARLRGIRWALDTICVPRYGLIEKYALDMSQAHDAGFDCKVTHYLFEEYKAIAAGQRPEPVIQS